jgi:hypothetical protein
MIGFDDVNRAVGNFGTSLGNLGSEFGKAQAAQREAYKAKSIAALGQGNVADAIRYARLADPSSTVGDDFTHAFGTERVAKPGAVNPAAGLATMPTPGAPAPTFAPKAVPTMDDPVTGVSAASLPTSLTPGVGSMPAPADLATEATDAMGRQRKFMGVNPRRIGLGAGDGVDETMTRQGKDLGVDEKDRGNITKMAAYLGIQKPESKYSSVDGYGLLEITPGYAGLPAEAKTLLAERLGMKERAGLLLDKTKLDQTRQLTLAEIKARIDMGNQDNATRKWIAEMGDDTERWKATIASNLKNGTTTLEQAMGLARIENDIRQAMPRGQDKITGRWTEEEDEYEARIAQHLAAYHNLAGVDLAGFKPLPTAPVAPETPAPLPPDWKDSGQTPGRVNPIPNPFHLSRPAPGPSTPPAKLPPAPVAPSPQTTFAPIASRSVPGGKAAPVLNGMVEEYKSAFGAQAVTSTARNAADDAAKGREYDSYHHHGKAFDATPALPSLQAAIQWGIERNARVLIEGDHIHYEPSQKGQGYVEVKKGSGGVYVDAYRALTSKPASKPAPGKPASKPAPKGATPRIQQLLNSTKPRD